MPPGYSGERCPEDGCNRLVAHGKQKCPICRARELFAADED